MGYSPWYKRDGGTSGTLKRVFSPPAVTLGQRKHVLNRAETNDYHQSQLLTLSFAFQKLKRFAITMRI